MIEIKITEIKKKALEFKKNGNAWHFHILTPECKLNKKDKYALIMENTTKSVSYVSYSEEPYMDIGKELVKLLHGEDVVTDNMEKAAIEKPSTQVRKILEKVKELNLKGKSWHHHMLFPGCVYNKHGDKWVIIFEDKENDSVIESVSNSEPKGDLKHIETLFYSQKKAK